MPQVQVIQPIQQQPKRLRVAAYARVSSDSEDQLNSLAVQVDYYTHLIQENPNWEFAGIYTDEGITGTSTKHREQFNRLMDDCRAGLIDRVLVKSASRFARNTADALTSVRELKSLGVTVAFEKEGFDTETSNGEMLLSIICAVAQEESLSISQNMKWGIHKRMRTGNYITNATPFGYTQINHQLVPEKNNAMIVNDIFKSYLSGILLLQTGFGRFLPFPIDPHDAVSPELHVRVDKDLQAVGAVLQDKIGAASYDDAGLFFCQLPDDPVLQLPEQVLVSGTEAAVSEGRGEEAAGSVLSGLLDVVFVKAAFGSQFLDQFGVVAPDAQMLCHQFADGSAAAAKLAADGDDAFFH